VINRRDFFRLGLQQMKEQARKRAPSLISREIAPLALDVSILTDQPLLAERIVDELVREHFGERFLRLRRSEFSSHCPGGIVLIENNTIRNFHDGASLFYAALRQVELDLHLQEIQSDPTLLRYVNSTPPFSRTAEIFHLGQCITTLQLTEDFAHAVRGTRGEVAIEVLDGRLRVTQSDCPHGICMKHPAIVTPGQRITCVPNDISIVIGATLS
jgi:hypothetical protein